MLFFVTPELGKMGKDRFGREMDTCSNDDEYAPTCFYDGKCQYTFPKRGIFTKKHTVSYVILYTLVYFILRRNTAIVDSMTPRQILNSEREMLCIYGNVSVGDAFTQGFIAQAGNSVHMSVFLHVRQITRHLSCFYKMNMQSFQFVYHFDYLNATTTQIEEQMTALATQFPYNQTFDAWYYPDYSWVATNNNRLSLKPAWEDPGWMDYLVRLLLIESVIMSIDVTIIVAVMCCLLIQSTCHIESRQQDRSIV